MFIYIKTKKAATGSKSDCSSLFILFSLSREDYPPKLSYISYTKTHNNLNIKEKPT